VNRGKKRPLGKIDDNKREVIHSLKGKLLTSAQKDRKREKVGTDNKKPLAETTHTEQTQRKVPSRQKSFPPLMSTKQSQ